MAERRARGDQGTVLMMLPAAVMIVLMLAAVAVDETGVYLAHRRLHAAAAAAANDAITAGLDLDAFNATGEYRLDPARVAAAVSRSLGAQQSETVDAAVVSAPSISVDASGRQTIQLTLTANVRLIFAGAIPGFDNRRRITERASASVVVQEP